MLIGELAQKSGFSRDTIRYYEKIGLLQTPRKARRENNYKEYPETSLARLKAVRQLKHIGYTLPEIRQTLESYETNTLDCPAGKQQVIDKVRQIDQQIQQLQLVKSQLLHAVAHCPDHCRIIEILDDTFLQ